MFAKGTSQRFELDGNDVWNVVMLAGISAAIVFVGDLASMLPDLQSAGGISYRVLVGVIGPALLTLKEWLTDYSEQLRRE